MPLLLNELSLHGQFLPETDFPAAIGHVMRIREIAAQFRVKLYCPRSLPDRHVAPGRTLRQCAATLSREERGALMRWLDQQGPFWEDERTHNPSEYMECNGQVVTDSAIGEAAWCRHQGLPYSLVSLVRSDWTFTPVAVTWHHEANSSRVVDVPNHWEPDPVRRALEACGGTPESWQDLAERVRTRCPNLNFTDAAFESLRGYPFVPHAADRILVLLSTLNRLRECLGEEGRRTAEGHQIYQNHFTGDRGWFSDSSDTEKRDFVAELTFRHPEVDDQFLFCPWHGKVNSPHLPIRIHFTWPVSPNEPLFVVYVGPKITRR